MAALDTLRRLWRVLWGVLRDWHMHCVARLSGAGQKCAERQERACYERRRANTRRELAVWGRVAVGLFAVLLAGTALNNLWFVHESLPYGRHVDEIYVSLEAVRYAKQGEIAAHTFYYPPLPRYLIGALNYLGWLLSDGELPLKDYPLQAQPYYPHAGIVAPVKYFWVALATCLMAGVGVLARMLTKANWTLVAAPFLLLVSELALYHSREYVNMDLLAAVVLVWAACYLLASWKRPGLLHELWLPAVWVALAASTKYTHALALLPFGVAVLARRHGVRRTLLTLAGLGALSAGIYLLLNPDIVIHHDEFARDIAKQRRNYAKGWPGYTVVAGWTHAKVQLDHMVDEFGKVLVGLAGIGVLVALWRQPLKAVAVLVQPVAFFAYFVSYPTDIARNLLPMYCLLPVFAVVALHAGGALLRKHPVLMRSRRARALALGLAAVTCGMLAWSLPVMRAVAAHRRPAEHRNVAQRWIMENVPKGATIYFSSKIGFDLRELEKHYEVKTLVLTKHISRKSALGLAAAREAYFVLPTYNYDKRKRRRKADVARCNGRLPRFNVLKDFCGTGRVMYKYYRPTPDGDPCFRIQRGIKFDMLRLGGGS